MKPQRFILCFERTNAREGYVWSVKIGRRWIHAREVHCWVDVRTRWEGARAKQPRAYLEGEGYVRQDNHGTITIASA